MADSSSASHRGAADSEPVPREIADDELQLLAQYTKQPDLAALRRHVVALWRRAISGDAPIYLCVRGEPPDGLAAAAAAAPEMSVVKRRTPI